MMRAMDYDEMIFHHPDAPPRKERAYSEDGVDLTLIRRLLLLSPAERLREMEEFLADLEHLGVVTVRCSSGRS